MATRGARPGLDEAIQSAAVVRADPDKPNLPALIERQAPEIERALPTHLKLSTEHYVRAALTLVKQTPLLGQCDPKTVLGGMMTAAQMGLEFGPLGHAYLLPFKNRRKTGSQWHDVMEAQFVLGYKGVVDLTWRSGKLESIIAREVYPEDEFDYEYGLADRLHHKPALNRDPETKPYVWYGVAKFRDGGHAFVVLGRGDVERHRARSKAAEKGPWVTDYSAMAKKSCILELKPWLPLTTEVARQLENDGAVVRGTTVDDLEPEQVDYIEVPFTEDSEIADVEVVDPGTGEMFANTREFSDEGHD